MFRSTMRYTLAAFTLLTVMATAAPALAASPAWTTVDVTLQTGDQGQSELVVSGTLPPDASLPAEAELAVPAGTEMRWIGEILGGPVSEDPALQYTKSVVRGMDVYRFTLTTSRIAQFEGDVQGAVTVDGTTRSTALKWTAWRALTEVNLRERLPEGAQITRPAKGATIEDSDAGYSFYSKTIKGPKAGDVLDLTFAYASASDAPIAAASPVGGTGSNSTALTIILVVVAMGIGMLVMGVWHRVNRAPQADAERRTSGATDSAAEPARAASRPTVVTSEPEPESARTTRSRKPKLAIAVICTVMLIAVVGAVFLATATPVGSGRITKYFGTASPCQNVVIPVVARQGVDLSAQGVSLVDAFKGQDGVGDVTLDITRSVVEIGFCESSQSEESVRRVLEATGLVTLGAAGAPVPAAAD